MKYIKSIIFIFVILTISSYSAGISINVGPMFSVGPNSKTFKASSGSGLKIYGHIDSIFCLGGLFRIDKFKKPPEQIGPDTYIFFIDRYLEFLAFLRIQNRNNFKYFFEPGVGLFVHIWEEQFSDQTKKGNNFYPGFSFDAGVCVVHLEIGTGYKIVFTGETPVQWVAINFGVNFETFRFKKKR